MRREDIIRDSLDYSDTVISHADVLYLLDRVAKLEAERKEHALQQISLLGELQAAAEEKSALLAKHGAAMGKLLEEQYQTKEALAVSLARVAELER